MSKKLVIYEQEYDLINFHGVITEDKLDEYIQIYINKKLEKSKIKFKVLGIIHKLELWSVSIPVLYDAYNVELPGGTKHYPESADGIGFDYYVVDDEQANSILK